MPHSNPLGLRTTPQKLAWSDPITAAHGAKHRGDSARTKICPYSRNARRITSQLLCCRLQQRLGNFYAIWWKAGPIDTFHRDRLVSFRFSGPSFPAKSMNSHSRNERRIRIRLGLSFAVTARNFLMPFGGNLAPALRYIAHKSCRSPVFPARTRSKNRQAT